MFLKKCAPLWAIYVLYSPFVLSVPLVTTLLCAVVCAVGDVCAIVFTQSVGAVLYVA